MQIRKQAKHNFSWDYKTKLLPDTSETNKQKGEPLLVVPQGKPNWSFQREKNMPLLDKPRSLNCALQHSCQTGGGDLWHHPPPGRVPTGDKKKKKKRWPTFLGHFYGEYRVKIRILSRRHLFSLRHFVTWSCVSFSIKSHRKRAIWEDSLLVEWRVGANCANRYFYCSWKGEMFCTDFLAFVSPSRAD